MKPLWFRSVAIAALLCASAADRAFAQSAVTLRDAATNKAAGVVGLPLFVQAAIGGAAVSTTNPSYVAPGTGVTWAATESGNWNVGGYDSGTSAVQTATPANASHSAGQSVGGLFSLPLLRTSGGGALLEYVNVYSVAGDTPTLQLRLWDRKPTNSNFACADNSAYANGSGSTGGTVTADVSHLIAPPSTVTLAAPTQTTGDAITYGQVQFSPPISVKNQDSATATYIYGCLVATATYTPGVGPYIVTPLGPQD